MRVFIAPGVQSLRERYGLHFVLYLYLLSRTFTTLAVSAYPLFCIFHILVALRMHTDDIETMLFLVTSI